MDESSQTILTMDQETPWGYERTPVDSQPAHQQIPLRFHQLFSECGPIQDQVDRSVLESLLVRAGLVTDDITTVLKTHAPLNPVDEQSFYATLFAAATQLGQDPEALHLAEPTIQQISGQDPIEFNLTDSRTIKVEIKPGKEGRWGFRHTVYIVSGSLHGSPVLVHRRYSDFVWLLDQLVQIYTFRLLPLLPPKKIQINGSFLSGDSSQFLYRRRLGLLRFLNLLVAHPVIGHDAAVAAFLTKASPVDLLKPGLSGRPQEFDNFPVQPSFQLEFNEHKFTDWVQNMEAAVESSLMVVTNTCKLLASQSRRLYAQANDSCNLTIDFQSLANQMVAVYPDNKENLEQITVGVAKLAKFNEQEHGAYIDAAATLQDGALEDIKYYRDVLLALVELLRRYRVYGGNTILQLKNRIERTRAKITALRDDPDENKTAKLEAKIAEYQQSIKDQVNRQWIMRQVLTQELKMVQSSQYQLARMLRNFASYRLSMAESFKLLATGHYDEVSDLPLK